MILAIFAAFTTETVANWIAPKKEGFFAIVGTIASMAWMIVGPFLCLSVALIFALLLALSR